VVTELRGEKIDIVPFVDDPADFVAKALSPAKVTRVEIDEQTGTAKVIVPDYQLSLAIGKEGQNARLAARLTGWRVDIKSETEDANEAAGVSPDGTEWAEGEWKENATTGEMEWHDATDGVATDAAPEVPTVVDEDVAGDGAGIENATSADDEPSTEAAE
jgi:transcription termination/antitermination protein NusA